jgi:hypothetical protein
LKKLFPENEHHDYYTPTIGWIYLGHDDEYDYYVNHEKQWTSVVYGSSPWQYISGAYDLIDDPDSRETSDFTKELLRRIHAAKE